MRHFGMRTAVAVIGTLALASPAAAQSLNSGDTAWMLTASTLVLFMTLPGLALFYGGLVRAKNLLSIFMQCFAICCVVSLIWAAFGYSLAYAGDAPWLGSLDNLFLAGLAEVRAGTTMPESVFALYQMTFAIITPALIIGAFPERAKFGFVLTFCALWVTLVYVPVAHWVWGGGWLAVAGVRDFAGGIVVHTTAGISALVAALMIGVRRGFPNQMVPPHSPSLTMIGAGMLWVGWFGFNGGSASAAGASAGSAILATHFAACAGALVWMVIEWRRHRPTTVGLATGCVAGLATITPAAGYVGPLGAILIGTAGGLICYAATVFFKTRLRVDDTLDVFTVHGVGGILGSLLLAPFALVSLGGTGLPGVDTLAGQFQAQLLGVGVTLVWSAAATWLIIRLLRLFGPVRVDEEAEFNGLDLSEHGERAYDLG